MKVSFRGVLASLIAATALATSAVAQAAPGDVVHMVSAPVQAPHHATYPLGLAHDGARLFIANIEEAANALSPFAIFVVDPGDGEVLDRIDYNTLNQTLKDMTWDGSRLWALNADRKRRLIDPELHQNTEGYATLTTRMRGIAWDVACGHVWEIVEETGTLGEHDVLIDPVVSSAIEVRHPESAELVFSSQTVSDHTYWYSLAHDGCSLWTVDRDALALVRIDGVSGAELERFDTPSDRPIGLTYDGEHLVLSDNGSDMLYFIEIGTAELSDNTICDPHAPPMCLVPGLEAVTPPTDRTPRFHWPVLPDHADTSGDAADSPMVSIDGARRTTGCHTGAGRVGPGEREDDVPPLVWLALALAVVRRDRHKV